MKTKPMTRKDAEHYAFEFGRIAALEHKTIQATDLAFARSWGSIDNDLLDLVDEGWHSLNDDSTSA